MPRMLKAEDVLKRLRELREEMDLRQDHLARSLGVDRSTYVRKELGAIPISTEEWVKIGRAMDRDPAFFFSTTPAGLRETDLKPKERLMVRLYRSLREKERDGLLCTIHVSLKSIRRRAVRDTLDMLRKS